jgi:acyl-CoA thioesterase
MQDPLMSLLGMEGEVTGPGASRVRGTLRAEHLNSLGMAHGGYLYTLADSAFALASNSHGVPAVALSTHIEYIKAGKPGDTVEAVAAEIHLGRSTGVYRVEIRCGETLLAHFTGTVFRKQPKSAEAAAGGK